MSAEHAERLAETPLERLCLAELRAAAGETGGGMERHCVRCFLFVERLAARRGLELDREVALCAAFLHDIGLYSAVSEGGVYTDEGGRLAARLFTDAGASAERARLCAEACANHHAVRDQSRRGAEVELLRVADRIELGGGLLTGGLPRAEVREVFGAVSRAGLYREVGRLVGHALRERPLTLPRIFRLRG